MAGLDASIYFQNQPVNFAERFQQGMSLGQMFKKQRDDGAINDAYKANMQIGPDGKPSFNRDGFIAALSNGGLGGQAMQYQNQWQKEDEARKQQQIENQIKQQEMESRALDRKDARDERRYLFGVNRQDKIDEKERAMARGDYLPLDQKKIVEGLATKNASKESIKNQIDAVMSGWDNLSEDQKVAQGRQLLKTLNSTEGADAIGAEEANRLGAKLEFALGNVFNSNPMQFGRDLEGFKEQANLTSKSIGSAIESNKQTIGKAMGRQTLPSISEADAAFKWAKQNPNDPRASKIMKELGVK